MTLDPPPALLTPGEVAALFRCDPKTVTRWAAAKKIASIRTPGGHHRFREADILALLDGASVNGVTADDLRADTGNPKED